MLINGDDSLLSKLFERLMSFACPSRLEILKIWSGFVRMKLENEITVHYCMS